MTQKGAIALILCASLALLAFSAVAFNREMTSMIESSSLAQYEILPIQAEAFTARMDEAGVNSTIDTIRGMLKMSLGMGEA